MSATQTLLSWPLAALAPIPALLAGMVWGLAVGKHPNSRLKPWSVKTCELLALPLCVLAVGSAVLVILSMGEYR